MAQFMDVHEGFHGVTQEQVEAAHSKDLEVEAAEGVHFKHWWADPASGKVFCLSEGPSKDAVITRRWATSLRFSPPATKRRTSTSRSVRPAGHERLDAAALLMPLTSDSRAARQSGSSPVSALRALTACSVSSAWACNASV
jgi:hypothetical protein